VVEKLRQDRLDLKHIRSLALRWANDNAVALRDADPVVPMELDDRAADNWRPLIAIADLVGGDWPDRARHAAKQLALAGADKDTIEVLLLGDIKGIFGRRGDHIGSADLCTELASIEDRPWSEWKHGKPITQVQLARLLHKFDIHPGNLKIGGKVPKGYQRDHFTDAFSRYLPIAAVSNATPLPDREKKAFDQMQSATSVVEVADRSATYPTAVAASNSEMAYENRCGSEVADQTAESEARTVRCRECAYFDGEDGATNCLRFGGPVDPEIDRQCREFRVPI